MKIFNMKPLNFVSFLLICFVLAAFNSAEDKRYKRTYYEDGTLESEGWMRFNVKTDYWAFYHPNGKLSEKGYYTYGKRQNYWFFYNEHRVRTKEGSYKDNEEFGWWLFYDTKGRINHKCQLANGIKNGYCLKYKEAKLISAEKYKEGKKIKEWTSFNAFTHENSLSDLK
jgi:antitoxin component YwqK of YwqJK toxin-antitoxin module